MPVERLGSVVRCAVCTQIFLLGIRPDDPSFDESELVEFDLVREGGIGPLVTPPAGTSEPATAAGQAEAGAGSIEALPEKIPIGITDRAGLFTREQIQARVAQVQAAMADGGGAMPPLSEAPAGHHLLQGGDFDPAPTSPAPTAESPVQKAEPVSGDQPTDSKREIGHDSDALVGELDQLDRDLRAFEDALNLVGAGSDNPILTRPARAAGGEGPKPVTGSSERPTGEPAGAASGRERMTESIGLSEFDQQSTEDSPAGVLSDGVPDKPETGALPRMERPFAGEAESETVKSANPEAQESAEAGTDIKEAEGLALGAETTAGRSEEPDAALDAEPVRPGDGANPPTRQQPQPRTILVPQSTKHSTAAARPMPRPIVASEPEVVKEAVAAFLADRQPLANGKAVEAPSSPALAESPPLAPEALADLEQQLEQLRKQQRAKIRQMEGKPDAVGETTGALADGPGTPASGNGKESPGGEKTGSDEAGMMEAGQRAEADRDVDFWRQSMEALAESMPDDQADETASQPAGSN